MSEKVEGGSDFNIDHDCKKKDCKFKEIDFAF